jgi:hypothetical protein
MAKTEMFPREFVEWWLWGSHPFIQWFDEKGKFITDEVSPKQYTLDDIYKHWLFNVKNKENKSNL